MSAWIQSPVLRLCQVSWRCSESGGEGCDVGWRLTPAMPIRVPRAGIDPFQPHMVGDLLLPGACPALVKPAALCQNASWMSYPSTAAGSTYTNTLTDTELTLKTTGMLELVRYKVTYETTDSSGNNTVHGLVRLLAPQWEWDGA